MKITYCNFCYIPNILRQWFKMEESLKSNISNPIFQINEMYIPPISSCCGSYCHSRDKTVHNIKKLWMIGSKFTELWLAEGFPRTNTTLIINHKKIRNGISNPHQNSSIVDSFEFRYEYCCKWIARTSFLIIVYLKIISHFISQNVSKRVESHNQFSTCKVTLVF